MVVDKFVQFPTADVEGFRDQLKEIQGTMVDGKFLGEDSTTPTGQTIVAGLLDRCFLWSDIVLTRYVDVWTAVADHPYLPSIDIGPRKGKIDERFKTTYDKLAEIRNQLERLSLTQAWSLRETDLYDYQRQLDRVDESRVDGNFEDPTGYKADLHAQRVCLAGPRLKSLADVRRRCFTSSAAAMRISTAS